MKSLAAIVVLALVSLAGCAAKPGAQRGLGITHVADPAAPSDHGDLARPFGQR